MTFVYMLPMQLFYAVFQDIQHLSAGVDDFDVKVAAYLLFNIWKMSTSKNKCITAYSDKTVAQFFEMEFYVYFR